MEGFEIVSAYGCFAFSTARLAAWRPVPLLQSLHPRICLGTHGTLTLSCQQEAAEYAKARHPPSASQSQEDRRCERLGRFAAHARSGLLHSPSCPGQSAYSEVEMPRAWLASNA
jgi:hypothetical protein